VGIYRETLLTKSSGRFHPNKQEIRLTYPVFRGYCLFTVEMNPCPVIPVRRCASTHRSIWVSAVIAYACNRFGQDFDSVDEIEDWLGRHSEVNADAIRSTFRIQP
jgi:hypothetical protein